MQRTPIKVPGKRKVDKSKSAIAARKSLNRSRGRPLQLEPSTSSKALKKKRIRKMAQPARERTLVERLPPEILARIFWFSMNFDMPRSSLELRNKLSDTSIYKKTVIEAFGPIWDLWYGYTDKHPPKDNQVDISETTGLVIHDRPGDHILEHNVLKCRWATVDLLIGAKELWIQRNALKRPFKPLEFLPQVGKACRVEQESRQTVAEYFAKDYAQFCEAIEDLDERALKKQCNWDKYTEIHYKTEIPDTLLKGPWDEDMTRTLFWLVRGGACIQWFGSTISEAAREGFKTAVETGNLRVLHLLDWMKAVRLHKREDEVLNAVRNACKRGGDNKLAIIKRVIHYGALEDRMTMDVKHLLDVLGLMEISNKELGNFERHALVTAVIGELEYIQRHHRRVR